MQPSPAQAADALAAVQASKAQLLKAASCPPERHLAFAGLMTGLVACPAAPVPVMLGIEALLLLGVAAVVQWDRRRTGMFVNGYRVGKTLWVTLPALVIELSLFGLGMWLSKERGIAWAPLVLAAPAFVIALGASLLWGRVWKGELQGKA